MNLGFIFSWCINFIIVSIVLALVDEHKQYRLERKPEVLFVIALLLPTILEILTFLTNGQPFLSVIFPIDWSWLFKNV